MKLTRELEIITLGDQIIAVLIDDDFSDERFIIKLNETASFILNLLHDDIELSEIVNAVIREYDVTEEVVKKDVIDLISLLESRGLVA